MDILVDVESFVSEDGKRGFAPWSQQSEESRGSQAQQRDPLQNDGEVTLPDETQRSHAPVAKTHDRLNHMAIKDHPQKHLCQNEKKLYNKLSELILQVEYPKTQNGVDKLIEHLRDKNELYPISIRSGCLIIRVGCPSLEILENLWSDYRSGRLEKEAERCLVTADVLREFNLKEVKLRVEISEEEYKACRHELMKQGEKFRTRIIK